MSVYHNMFLKREVVRGWGPLSWLHNHEMRKRSRAYIESIGIGTLRSVSSEVATLSGGQRQAIAIARSVHSGARTILLDEPLAAMGAKEGEVILDLIRDLKEQGHSMIVVAHNYIHIIEICDRVNMLQHGRITLDKPTRETSAEELTEIVAAEYRARRTRTG
jgi:ABC-type sugar transport system ATPase subunit